MLLNIPKLLGDDTYELLELDFGNRYILASLPYTFLPYFSSVFVFVFEPNKSTKTVFFSLFSYQVPSEKPCSKGGTPFIGTHV